MGRDLAYSSPIDKAPLNRAAAYAIQMGVATATSTYNGDSKTRSTNPNVLNRITPQFCTVSTNAPRVSKASAYRALSTIAVNTPVESLALKPCKQIQSLHSKASPTS